MDIDHEKIAKKMAICKPSRGLRKNQPCSTQILDFQSPELFENKCLSFKPHCL